MKKLLLAGLAGLAAVAGSTPAQAHPTYHYVGGCGFFTISDGTDSSQTKWDGEIHAAVIATDATTGAGAAVSITVECELRINGVTPGTIVYSASGTGAAVGGGQFSFHADPDDVVTMCDNVTVGGTDYHKDCGDATTTPIIPEPVQEIITQAVEESDKTICAITKSEDDGPYDRAPFDIRDDGDLYILDEWVWDCPPYGQSGPPGS